MTKEELRNKYKMIRHNIIDKNYQNELIFNQLINQEEIISANTILIYVSFNYEVDTFRIMEYFFDKKRIAVPKVSNNDMDFYYINSFNDLEKGYFNILEPITNNKVTNYDNCICIVPGICFDKYNNRIGYGKGYYDRFLKDKNIYTIGLTYDECIIEYIQGDITDIKLNKVLSSKKKLI